MPHVNYQTASKPFLYENIKEEVPSLFFEASYFIFNWEIFTGISTIAFLDKHGEEISFKKDKWLSNIFLLTKILLLLIYLSFFATILGIIFSVSLIVNATFLDIIEGLFILFFSLLWLFLVSKIGKKVEEYVLYDLPLKNNWVMHPDYIENLSFKISRFKLDNVQQG